MADDVRRIYWDACLFLDLINQREPVWQLLEAQLDRSLRRDEIRIVTSTISITEVATGGAVQVASWDLTPEDETAIDALWDIRGPVDLIEFHRGIALRARDIMRQTHGRIKGLDAIHVASAIFAGAAELCTYDADHLLPMGDSLGISIREPSGSVQLPINLESDSR